MSQDTESGRVSIPLQRELDGWIDIAKKKPKVLNVRILLLDGSELNCWAQSDGDFYWKGGGGEMFIADFRVTHWKPRVV